MSELTWREMHEFAIEQQVVLFDRVHELNQEVSRLKAELTASDAALKESRANDMESMRQLAELKAKSEWHPIETAPNDGTLFLCYHTPFDDEEGHLEEDFFVGFFDKYFVLTRLSTGRLECMCATHWMPLPETPK